MRNCFCFDAIHGLLERLWSEALFAASIGWRELSGARKMDRFGDWVSKRGEGWWESLEEVGFPQKSPIGMSFSGRIVPSSGFDFPNSWQFRSTRQIFREYRSNHWSIASAWMATKWLNYQMRYELLWNHILFGYFNWFVVEFRWGHVSLAISFEWVLHICAPQLRVVIQSFIRSVRLGSVGCCVQRKWMTLKC